MGPGLSPHGVPECTHLGTLSTAPTQQPLSDCQGKVATAGRVEADVGPGLDPHGFFPQVRPFPRVGACWIPQHQPNNTPGSPIMDHAGCAHS